MASRLHPLNWLLEDLAERPDYIRRSMFGCEAVYLHGKLVLALAAKPEPWNGVLCPTSREHHEALTQDFGSLRPHPILPKWLYLSADTDGFETVAQAIVQLIADGDERFGVEPPIKGKPQTKRRRRAKP